MEENLNELIKIFKDEILVYEEILKLETKKTSIIQKSNEKDLEVLLNQISERTNIAHSLEEKRNSCIKEFMKKKEINLKDFLLNLEKNWKEKFEILGENLKNVIFKLKKKIALNENIITLKQELLQDIFKTYRKQNKVNVYSNKNHKEKVSNPSSLILNTTI